jgi:hypothetical protein
MERPLQSSALQKESHPIHLTQQLFGRALTELCARLWESMADLYRSVFGEDFSGDVYAGEDIKILASLRDQAESRLS